MLPLRPSGVGLYLANVDPFSAHSVANPVAGKMSPRRPPASPSSLSSSPGPLLRSSPPLRLVPPLPPPTPPQRHTLRPLPRLLPLRVPPHSPSPLARPLAGQWQGEEAEAHTAGRNVITQRGRPISSLVRHGVATRVGAEAGREASWCSRVPPSKRRRSSRPVSPSSSNVTASRSASSCPSLSRTSTLARRHWVPSVSWSQMRLGGHRPRRGRDGGRSDRGATTLSSWTRPCSPASCCAPPNATESATSDSSRSCPRHVARVPRRAPRRTGPRPSPPARRRRSQPVGRRLPRRCRAQRRLARRSHLHRSRGRGPRLIGARRHRLARRRQRSGPVGRDLDQHNDFPGIGIATWTIDPFKPGSPATPSTGPRPATPAQHRLAVPAHASA